MKNKAGRRRGNRGRAFNGLTMQVSLLECEKSCINDDSQVPTLMKNVYEVLRQKEMELTRLEKEVEALRLVAPLLSEEKEMNSDMVKPMAQAVNGPQAPIRIASPPVVSGTTGTGRRLGRYREALAVGFSENLLLLSTRGFSTAERRFSRPGILSRAVVFWLEGPSRAKARKSL